MKRLKLIKRSMIVQQKLLRERQLKKPYQNLQQLDFQRRSRKNWKQERLNMLNLSSNLKLLKS
jgi:hypothetical protein